MKLNFVATVAFTFSALVVGTSLALSEDWPGWRGPNRDGHTSQRDLPTVWSATENVLWKTPVPGIGHASPIVWQDSIFLTTCEAEDLSRRLLKIDRQTGDIIWNREIAVSPIEEMHRDNTPASATPVTDGQQVYVVFLVNGGLEVTAVDFQGKTTWKRRVGEFEASHGFCSNLVLDGDQLFLSGLQDGPDAFISALDKHTGEVVWKVPRSKHIRSYSSPYLCRVQGRPAVLLSGADQTAAYDRETGRLLWEIDGPGSKTVSSVVVSETCYLAFVCGGRDNRFFAISMNNSSDAQRAEPKIAWQATKGIPYMTSPLLAKGKLHILSDEGIYRCYDSATGEVLNERRAVGAVRASMIANEDYIYVTEVSGRTTVIENNEHWEVVAKNDLGEEVVASPAVAAGTLFIRTDKTLFAIGGTVEDGSTSTDGQ